MCCGSFFLGKANSDKKKYEQQQCAVCFGIDGDASLKKCYYCYACNEWICDDCETRWLPRGLAAVKKLFRFFKS